MARSETTVLAPVEGRAVAAGIGMALAAFLLFTTMDTLIKWLTGGYPLIQIIFFNALFGAMPATAVGLWQGGAAALRSRRKHLHALRAVIGVSGALCTFFAFSRMPLADTYAIIFTAPLFITALSVPMLGEKVGWRRWTAVAVGFLGVVVMLRPGTGMAGLPALGALGGAATYAVSMLMVRRIRDTESAVVMVFYGNLTVMALTGLALPFVFVPPTAADFALSAACGLFAGIGGLLLVGAFRRAPAAVLAPFQYTQMVWGVLYGLLIFGDRPDGWLAVGSGIVIASGLYILHRETRAQAPALQDLPAEARPVVAGAEPAA